MNNNLYFMSSKFSSNKSLADYIFDELNRLGFSPSKPVDSDFMYIITTNINNVTVEFYMGKNDEESEPPLWQIWPEQRVSYFAKLFGNVDKSPEEKAKSSIEKIVSEIEGVTNIEWDK